MKTLPEMVALELRWLTMAPPRASRHRHFRIARLPMKVHPVIVRSARL
jgi:hypothetical protein